MRTVPIYISFFLMLTFLSCEREDQVTKFINIENSIVNLTDSSSIIIYSNLALSVSNLKIGNASGGQALSFSSVNKLSDNIFRAYLSNEENYEYTTQCGVQCIFDEVLYKSAYFQILKPKLDINMLKVEKDEIIYDNSCHAAFTDIIEYDNSCFVTFREAKRHAPSDESEYGKIIIMNNHNQSWNVIADMVYPGYDLRDPKLYVIKGNLYILCGIVKLVDGELTRCGNAISRYNGESFGPLEIMSLDTEIPFWIWRLTESDSKFYGIGYKEGLYPVLFESSDLKEWKSLSEIPIPGVPTEADLVVRNNKMNVVIRRDNSTSFFCTADGDYKKWICSDMGVRFESPCIGYIDDNYIIVAGRYRSDGCQETAILKYCYHTNESKCLYITDNKPSDNAYPGLFIKYPHLYMSYYEGTQESTRIHYCMLNI